MPEQTDDQKAWDEVMKEDSPILEVDPIKAAEAKADDDIVEEDPVIVEATPKVDPLDEMKQHLLRIEENNSKQMRDLNGRFGGLADQMKQIAKEATVAKAAAAPGDAAAIKEASKTPEKWEAFKKEWEGSNIVESIEEYVATHQLDPTSLVEERIAKATAELNQQYTERESKLMRQIVDLTMEQAHKGWKTTVNTPEFNAWRTAQPPAIQNLSRSDDPQDAIAMLNLFKSTAAAAADTKTKAEANKERLQNAVNPIRSEVAPRKTLSLDDMTPEQFWAYEARIQATKNKSA